MQSKTRQYVFGVLAVAGVVATWYFNLRFMGEQAGFDIAAFVAGGYANAAASSFTNDLMIGVLAFLVFLVAESRRLGMRHVWVYVLLTFGIAFAFSFPLFLLMRERRLAELEGAPA